MGKIARLFKRNNKKDKAPGEPPTPDKNTRLYAVGDVHGRLDLFNDLLKAIKKDAKSFAGKTQLILLGDYIDRGPESAGVIETIVSGGLPCDKQICLRGNHEEAMLNFADGSPAAYGWLQYGGLEALQSYGIKTEELIKGSGNPMKRLRDALLDAVPKAHMQFLKRLPFSYTNGDYFFVHAGVRPKVPLLAQDLGDMLWIREDFLKYKKPFEQFIIHGHTITTEPDVQTNRIGIDTGAYKTGVLTCLVMEGAERRFMMTQA